MLHKCLYLNFLLNNSAYFLFVKKSCSLVSLYLKINPFMNLLFWSFIHLNNASSFTLRVLKGEFYHPDIYLFGYLFIRAFIFFVIYPFINLFIRLLIHLSGYLFIWLLIYTVTYLLVYILIRIFISSG